MKKVLALLCALLSTPVAAQVIPSGPWGSLNYWGVGGASQVLNPGTPGYCLETQGTGSAPVWIACPGSALNLLPGINTNQFYGNVSGQFGPPVGVDVNTILNTVGYDIARPPAVESILYKSNVGPTFNWQALPPSPQGWILTSGGPTNPPFWSPTPTQSNLASICQTVGALLYFDTPSLLWKCLNPGTAGQVLQTTGAGANPVWFSGNTLSSTNDTNVTVTLGGTPGTALLQPASITMGWTGTLAAARLNSNVVQAVTNDTNVTGSIAAQNLTLGWTGTLAAARLNSNVVQSVTNDTNVTGSIATQNMTLGWTGTLAVARGGTGGGTASGTLLDNITGFASTGVLNRTGAGAYSFLTAPAGTIVGTTDTQTLTNKTLDTAGPNTLKVSGVTLSTGQYPGTTTNDNATAGNVGEYVESIVASGSALALTSATAKTIASISLTAGDWDVSGNLSFNGNGGVSITFVEASLSTTSNAVDQTAGRNAQINQAANVPSNLPSHSLPVGPARFSLSTTTTINIVANSNFTVGTLAGWGIIRARRVR